MPISARYTLGLRLTGCATAHSRPATVRLGAPARAAFCRGSGTAAASGNHMSNHHNPSCRQVHRFLHTQNPTPAPSVLPPKAELSQPEDMPPAPPCPIPAHAISACSPLHTTCARTLLPLPCPCLHPPTRSSTCVAAFVSASCLPTCPPVSPPRLPACLPSSAAACPLARLSSVPACTPRPYPSSILDMDMGGVDPRMLGYHLSKCCSI